jgi:uncharacterized membrane protein YhaH (DUF805 family)
MVDLLFSFHGRINRSQYWTAGIAVGFIGFLIAFSLLLATGLTWGASKEEMLRALMGFMLALVPLFGVMTWISMALQVKRFHDRGQSGFWALLPLGLSLPVMVGAVMLLPILWLVQLGFLVNLGFLPGVEGENRFGPPPGSPGSYTPKGPRPASAAANSLFGAEQAMERALAEQKLRASAPAPTRAAAATPARATPAQPSFGRRIVQ